jgi:hypothetical protein
MESLKQMKFAEYKHVLLQTQNRILLLLLFFCYSNITPAFFEWQEENSYVEARGLLRGFVSSNHYPKNSSLYPQQDTNDLGAIARLVVFAEMNNKWSIELNTYQTYISQDVLVAPGSNGTSLSVERSAIFEHSFSHQDFVHLALDRFALRWSHQDLDITIGRQAINLATTFYFTPNDFFSPFAAQSFFRVYKSGVDALRAELSLDEFSQLSFITVLGYKAEINSDTGWSNDPDSHRTSHLLRWSNTYGDMDVSILLGHIIDKNIFGIGLQGELFDWLGIRLEGHYANPNQSSLDNYQQLSLGLEHRWENTLQLRLELFYNGLGSQSVSDYQLAQNQNKYFYLARHYSALGGSYEISPLLIAEAVLLSNFIDQSQLLSLNTVYSLSDESEMVFNVSLPFGKAPVNRQINSEFGYYPISLNIELRSYF